MDHSTGYSYEFERNRGRSSGGILIYYRNFLKNNFLLCDKWSGNILLLKKSKGVINQTKKVYIAGVCNSPRNSAFTENNDCNVIDTLKQQLPKFSSGALTVGSGDFNSQVGTEQDFITERPQLFKLDNWSNLGISGIVYGKQLLNLCVATKLRTLNGRNRGDFQEHLTV